MKKRYELWWNIAWHVDPIKKDYNAIVASIYVLGAWIFAVEVLLLINRFNTQPDITY